MKRATAVLILAVTALITGCAQQWTKPGLTQDEFQRDRYACLQGSQQAQSSFVIGQYVAGGGSGMVTNDVLFRSCMTSKGCALQTIDPSGKILNAPPIMVEAQNANTSFASQMKDVCTNSELAAYFAMTPCNVSGIEFRHIADESKITEQQKTVFLKARAALDSLNKQQLTNARKFGGEKGKRMADIAESFQGQADQNNLDLYNGQITWGSYNKRRREVSSQINARM